MHNGMQLSFGFLDAIEPLPVLDMREQRETLANLAKQAGIYDLVNLDAIGLRPRQYVLIRELCKRHDENLLLEAGTGLGKTLIFIFRALMSISQGKQSILITTEDKLVKQGVKKILVQTKLQKHEVLGLSCKIAAERRAASINSQPKVIITTPGVMVGDFNNYNWDNIDFVMFDETQNIVGNASARILAGMIKKQRSELTHKLTVCGMSATLASTAKNLMVLKDALEAARIVTVSNPNDLAESGDDKIKIVQVKLDKQSARILNHLKLLACRLIHELEKSLQEAELFPVPKDVQYWMPFFGDRDALRARLYNPLFKHSELGELRSKLSELECYCDLHSRLLSMGLFVFLEKYCYTKCQWLFSREHKGQIIELPEMSSTKEGDSLPLGSGKIKALRNEKLHNLVAEYAEQTPYMAVINASSWTELKLALVNLDYDMPESTAVNTQRRLAMTKSRNDSLLSRSLSPHSKVAPETAENMALLRTFFNYSLGFMARRELNDHQKEYELLEKLNEVRGIIPNCSSFIFTPLTRHAEFLAERLELRCSSPIVRPIAAHGSKGPGMDKLRQTALEGFNNKKFNILVTTVAFAGTGIDVENATIGVHYALSNSNHIQLVQANGRVLGRADVPLIFLLWSKGSQDIELKRFLSAVSKEKARRKNILRTALVLEPEFEVA